MENRDDSLKNNENAWKSCDVIILFLRSSPLHTGIGLFECSCCSVYHETECCDGTLGLSARCSALVHMAVGDQTVAMRP